MSLRNFLSSRTGKRFYNFCYCWGAEQTIQTNAGYNERKNNKVK